MHVVGHQYIGVDQTITGCCRLLQCFEIKRVVLFVKKHGLPVDAACYDMLRNIGDEVSALARHSRIVLRRYRCGPCSKSY